MRKPEAVYIDSCQKLTSRDLPHHKVVLGKVTWLLAQLPEGDWRCHHHGMYNGGGYGDALVEFLIVDGTFESFKGPYHSQPDDSSIAILEQRAGITGLANRAIRVDVGENICDYCKVRKVLFSDEFSLTPLSERIKPEYEKYDIIVWSRDMGRHIPKGSPEHKKLFAK